MCLITNHKIPEILEEDLIVYKLLTRSGKSFYQKFKYDFDSLYETDFSFIDKKDSDKWNYLDGKDSIALSKNYYSDMKTLVDIGEIICIAQGFHSSLTKKRLHGLDKSGATKIFTCTIPKGATIYRGYTDLIVSNKIIVHKNVKSIL